MKIKKEFLIREQQQPEVDGEELISFNFSGWVKVRKLDLQPHVGFATALAIRSLGVAVCDDGLEATTPQVLFDTMGCSGLYATTFGAEGN